MGVNNSDEQASSEMAASKPKERQFQVVPVPGTFTRGRWKCWDYKDKTSETVEVIDFTDKSDKPPATITVAENVASYTATPGTQTEPLNHTLSEPRIMPSADINAAVSQPIDVPNPRKESSTIVVTSIAPPSVTPVHGTPSSTNISPITNTTNVIHDSEDRNGIVVDGGGDFITSHEKSSALQPTVSSPILSQVPTTNSPGVQLQTGLTTSQIYIVPSATAPNLLQAQEIQDPNLSVQTSASSFPADAGVVNVPLTLNETEDSTTTNVSAAGPNVVAIDNKIEQAMDLVKTHLTFAVREEVEILRSTIVELEAKVAQLESQNQVLKQFAPLEVVNSLAVLVQQQQQKQLQLQQQQQQLSSGGTAPNPQQTNATQNVSQPQQNMQQLQSMPTLSTEASAAPALTTAASAGLIVETQPITELQLPHVINEPEKQQ